MSHTKGPWMWQANTKTGRVYLATEGRGRVYIMGAVRNGMQGGTFQFQEHRNECDGTCSGCGIMHKAQHFASNEDHNGEYEIDNPDARLIVAAPDLLEALQALVDRARSGDDTFHYSDAFEESFRFAEAAIAKAKGEACST